MTESFIILNFAEARQPEYKEKKGQGYMEFGEMNDYPNYLLDLYNKSAKHNAIIRGKVNYINGNGWKAGEADAVGESFIAAPNPYESLHEISRKVETDIEIFGGSYVEVIWSQVGGQLSAIYHIDYMKVRTNEDNTQYWIKKDWSDRKEIAEVYPAFSSQIRQGKQILYLKEYRPGLKAYALPGYMGSLNYIESDIEVSKHVLGNAQTGFSASKMITLPNGEPSPEEKRNIERRFSDRFTGSDGKKFILSFVNDPTRKPIIDDLGASDLTKEDFGRVDSMIQQNIFAGHQITTPTLFGIQEPGQLGTRSQLRDSYEIFKNTYVSDKQQFVEQVFTKLARIKGATSDLTIIPVEPISLELSEAAILTVAPKEWVLEKAGIDITKYQPEPTTTDVQTASVNDSIKNLTGRQYQQVLRIIRQFGQGKITKEIAQTMLRSGYGLSDGEIDTMLGTNEEFSHVFDMDETIQMFSEYGVNRSDYNIIESKPLQFADVTDEIDKQILTILKDQPLLRPEDIAAALKISVDTVNDRLKRLIKNEIVRYNPDKGSRELTKPLSEIIDQKVVTTFEVKYSYEWRNDIPQNQRNSANHPSRPFCARLMEIDKLWDRDEIERLSFRLGYSVFDRRGGWWTKPNGDHSPSCRHIWVRNIVVKKN
jgi:DNA-binding CsgD family transcriptional regulator